MECSPMDRKEVTVKLVGKCLDTIKRLQRIDGSKTHADVIKKALAIYEWYLVDGRGCDILLRKPDGSMARLVAIK